MSIEAAKRDNEARFGLAILRKVSMHDNTAAVSFAGIEEAFFFDVGSLYEYLENLQDHRDPRGVRYPLPIARGISVFFIGYR